MKNQPLSTNATSRCVSRAVLVGIALAASTLATAAGLGFMKDSPYAKFTAEDRALFEAELDQAMSAPGGSARKWSNPATKAGGEIRLIKSFTRGTTPCGVVYIANRAKGAVPSKGELRLCKDAAGKWGPAD